MPVCKSFSQQGREVTFHLDNGAAFQLKLCGQSVVRIWYSPDGKLQRLNSSFAVINEELEDVGVVNVNEEASCYEIFTPVLRIRVNKSPLKLQVFDKYQKLIFSDYGDGRTCEGEKKVEYKMLRRDEHFFGLGEKTGKLDRRGETYKMWNSDYPKLEEEKKIIRQNINGERTEVRPILKAEDIIAAREVVRQVYLDEKIEQYIADIVFATRYPEKYDLKELKGLIGFGGSPRASINLALAARSYAFIKRRGYVIPEDVRAVAHDVLRHRIGLTYEAEATNVTSDEIVSKILNKVEVP